MSENGKKKYPVGSLTLSMVARVGTDPQVVPTKNSDDQGEAVNFRVVVSPYNGNREPADYWFSVRATGSAAAFAKTLKKGDLVSLHNGDFSTYEYQDQKSGQTKFILQYAVRTAGSLVLVSKKPGSVSTGNTAPKNKSVPHTTQPSQKTQNNFVNNSNDDDDGDDEGDDVPF